MLAASAIETIVAMRGEIVQALWETFIMVGLSTTFATLFGTLLGVLLFVTANRQPEKLIPNLAAL